MEPKELVRAWFKTWEVGDIYALPLSEEFVHISPYGKIEGRKKYLQLVEADRNQFLGHRFELLDEMYKEDRACVRYLAIKGDFKMEVSEWYYLDKDSIAKIIAYYNIEEEKSEIRKLYKSGS